MMGTNFYFKKTKQHIGKKVFKGEEMVKNKEFILAMNPTQIKDLDYVFNQGCIIIDEYGYEYTYKHFLQILQTCELNYKYIGKDFC